MSISLEDIQEIIEVNLDYYDVDCEGSSQPFIDKTAEEIITRIKDS